MTRDQMAVPRAWWRRATNNQQAGGANEDMLRASLPAALGSAASVMAACRLLRVNLSPTGVPPPLVVIAPVAEAACALVAAGLAAALAEEGRHTLLVDADLRAPLLHTLFGIPATPGFAAMLAAGAVDQTNTVAITPTLAVLPAGQPGFSPALIFRRERAATVTRLLAQQYEAVVYHIAGTWTSPELLTFAPLVGAAVFTLRAGIETADHIRRMNVTLERSGVRALGFALVGGQP